MDWLNLLLDKLESINIVQICIVLLAKALMIYFERKTNNTTPHLYKEEKHNIVKKSIKRKKDNNKC